MIIGLFTISLYQHGVVLTIISLYKCCYITDNNKESVEIMNTKNNQRTRLSKMLLKNAMLDLLELKKSIEKVSVRELCEKAELNRSTFYAHYNEPADLLNETEDELLNSASEYLGKIGRADDVNAASFILAFLKFIKKNDKEFRILLVDSYDSGFKDKFMRMATSGLINFDLNMKSDEEQYVYSYILNGSSSVIIQWIRSGYSIDENKLVELLFCMNKNLLTGLSA